MDTLDETEQCDDLAYLWVGEDAALARAHATTDRPSSAGYRAEGVER